MGSSQSVPEIDFSKQLIETNFLELKSKWLGNNGPGDSNFGPFTKEWTKNSKMKLPKSFEKSKLFMLCDDKVKIQFLLENKALYVIHKYKKTKLYYMLKTKDSTSKTLDSLWTHGDRCQV